MFVGHEVFHYILNLNRLMRSDSMIKSVSDTRSWHEQQPSRTQKRLFKIGRSVFIGGLIAIGILVLVGSCVPRSVVIGGVLIGVVSLVGALIISGRIRDGREVCTLCGKVMRVEEEPGDLGKIQQLLGETVQLVQKNGRVFDRVYGGETSGWLEYVTVVNRCYVCKRFTIVDPGRVRHIGSDEAFAEYNRSIETVCGVLRSRCVGTKVNDGRGSDSMEDRTSDKETRL
jgi:hypothetical protein